MKELMIKLLALTLMLSSLMGCKAVNEVEPDSFVSGTESEETAESTQEESSEAEEEVIDIQMNDLSIAEQIVYDANGIKIIAKRLDMSDPSYATLYFEVQNASGKDIDCNTNYLLVNDLYLGGHVFTLGTTDCKNGETIEVCAEIPRSAMKIANIELIKDIEVSFYIEYGQLTTGEGGTELQSEGFFEEGTAGAVIKTNCPESYMQEVDTAGTVLVDEQGIRVVMKDFYITESGYLMGSAYFENNASQLLRTRIYVHKINGIEIEESGRFGVLNGYKGFGGISLYTEAEELGITSIESIEVSCKVYYEEGVNDVDVIPQTEPITITFK